MDAWEGDRTAWEACQRGGGLDGWHSKLPTFEAGTKLATRVAVNQCLTASADVVPGLVVGSADLTGNTGVKLKDGVNQEPDTPGGSQVHFGIREHAMGAAMTGMARHGGVLPVGGTFFCFSDYMRPSVRMAAISESHVVYFWTHDSVGLGEDGPTHQPIEHLASLRAMPQLRVIRPADANETAHAWRIAVDRDGPTALVLSRQSIPVLEGTADAADGVARGGYVLVDTAASPDVVLIGTGSEVSVCVAAAGLLADASAGAEPIRARVVSLPSWDLFGAQSEQYRAEVLPPGVPRLAVEAAASFGWERYADDVVAIDHFGASAPGDQVLAHFGYTPENVASRARALLAARTGAAH
jgi:transketolase